MQRARSLPKLDNWIYPFLNLVVFSWCPKIGFNLSMFFSILLYFSWYLASVRALSRKSFITPKDLRVSIDEANSEAI